MAEIGKARVKVEFDEESANKGVENAKGGILAKFKGIGVAAGAALGIGIGAAGATLVASIGGAIDNARLNDKLAAQLNLSTQDSQRFGKIAGDLYSGAYGDSLETVNDALRNVTQNIGGTATASNASLKTITASVLDVATAFDQDLGATTRAVGQLIKTGLAANATEALDIVTAGFQAGVDKSEDFLDTLNEYGTQFRKLGLDGTTATGLLSQGLQGGARDADVVADAIKEFSIRAVDGSTTSAAGFKALGLSAKDLTAQIAQGGKPAAAGLQLVLDRLRNIKDPVAQSAAAVALFGTQAEDLGSALFALDPSNAEQALGKVGGAAARMGQTLNDNASTNLESFKRQLTQGFVNVLGGQVLPVVDQFATTLATRFGPTLSAVGETLKSVAGFIQQNSTLFGSLAAAVAGGAIAFGTYRAVVGTISAVTKAWAAVQAALNVVLSANPIGIVVIALAALVAALIFAYHNSETFRNVVTGVFGAVKSAVSAVVGWFTGPFVNFFKSAFATVTGALRATGNFFATIWNAIRSNTSAAVSAVVGFVTSGFNRVGSTISSVISAARSTLTQQFNAMRSVVSSVIGAIRSAVSSGVNNVLSAISRLSAIPGQVRGWFTSAKTGAISAMTGLVSYMRGLPGRIVSAVGNIAGRMAAIGRSIIDGIVSGIRGAAGRIRSAVQSYVINALPGPVRKALGIGSPSKVFADIGYNTSLGMAVGLEKGAKRIDPSVLIPQPRGIAGASPGLGAAGSAGGSFGGDSYTFNMRTVDLNERTFGAVVHAARVRQRVGRPR